jgi:hypothetical protein
VRSTEGNKVQQPGRPADNPFEVRRLAALILFLALPVPAADAAELPACPAALHDSYLAQGPDGARYPTWHPPVVRNPATGADCAFGHEHGRDPRRSKLWRTLVSHENRRGARRRGPAFGYAAAAFNRWRGPAAEARVEDHFGYKVEWQNNVRLKRSNLASDGNSDHPTALRTRCDFLAIIHQGTHSPDALRNNLHELHYYARCTDGTKLAATVMSAIGEPGGFVRSCDKQTRIRVAAPTPADSPRGGGVRFIPDATCIDRHVLVGKGRYSDYSGGLYEDWVTANYLRTADGRQLAYFDPHFAVFNPARYHDASAPNALARTAGICWLESGDRRARGGACDAMAPLTSTPLAFDDPRSGFDGSHRETYFNQTSVANRDGRATWWTDPLGGNAAAKPFPGAIAQHLCRLDNSARPTLESQAFGATRPYGGRGVHAPN